MRRHPEIEAAARALQTAITRHTGYQRKVWRPLRESDVDVCQARVSAEEIEQLIVKHGTLGEEIALLRREVPRLYVEDADRADLALEAAAKDLGITGVVIKYFSDPKRPEVRGFVNPAEPRTIWVSAELKGPYLVRTVGHEAKHVQQLLRGYDVDEAPASRYGERLMSSDWSKWPRRVEPRWD